MVVLLFHSDLTSGSSTSLACYCMCLLTLCAHSEGTPGSAWRGGDWEGNLINVYMSLSRGCQEPVHWWCQAIGQEATGRQWNTAFHMNMRKNFFAVKVTQHWNKLPCEVLKSPWRYSKTIWTQFWVTCSRGLCLNREAPGGPPVVPYLFCNSVKLQ